MFSMALSPCQMVFNHVTWKMFTFHKQDSCNEFCGHQQYIIKCNYILRNFQKKLVSCPSMTLDCPFIPGWTVRHFYLKLMGLSAVDVHELTHTYYEICDTETVSRYMNDLLIPES